MLELTKLPRMSICLPEYEQLRVSLSTEIVPLMLRSVVDMNVFKNFVSIDNILRFKIFLGIE